MWAAPPRVMDFSKRDWAYASLSPAMSCPLGHLLDHSTLPVACSRAPTFTHFTPGNLPPMNSPLLPVVFPTHATRTKWGFRELTPKEIALCLDALFWIVSNPILSALFVARYRQGLLVPLKLLQASLQACLAAIDPSPPVTSLLSPDSSTPFHKDRPGSWLPLLKKWLPSHWVEAASVSATAAKSDNAKIFTDLWDSRISLVLPCSEAALRMLRSALFG